MIHRYNGEQGLLPKLIDAKTPSVLCRYDIVQPFLFLPCEILGPPHDLPQYAYTQKIPGESEIRLAYPRHAYKCMRNVYLFSAWHTHVMLTYVQHAE